LRTQLTTLHMWDKRGIYRQTFNRKSISRNTSHRQSNLNILELLWGRTVVRKSLKGVLFVSAEGLDIVKIDKAPLISSVSYFNLGSLEHCLGGLSLSKHPVVTRLSWGNFKVLELAFFHCRNVKESPNLFRFVPLNNMLKPSHESEKYTKVCGEVDIYEWKNQTYSY